MTVTASTTFKISGSKITLGDLRAFIRDIDIHPVQVMDSVEVSVTYTNDQRDGRWTTLTITSK